MQLIFSSLLILFLALPVYSAQETLDDGDSFGTQRTKINSNFTELYSEVSEDLTASEIVALIDAYYGSTTWRTQDGYEANTDSQGLDVFSLSGTTLSISLNNDGVINYTVDLAALQDGYEANTDDQTASEVSVTDTADNFTGTTVEDILAELFAAIGTGGDGGTDDQTASEVTVTVTNFDNNLSAGHNTVQLALDAIDNLAIGSGAVSSVNTQTGAVVLDADDLADGSTNIIPTATQETNWDTAYTWGDHAAANYSTFDGVYTSLSSLPTLGTAAALDVGTGANQVVQLNASANLDFAIGIDTPDGTGNLAVTDDTLQELADAFDSFAGGGTDNQTAAEVNITDSGAYYTGTTVETALQEIGAGGIGGSTPEDTAYDATWDGDTDAASKNALYDKIETLSAGSAPTIQSADPTAASATGFYGATTSGDFFYKSADGLFNLATGVYTVDPTTYSLTVDMIDGNGTDLFTYLTTDYTTDQTFTGLSADATFTVTADTGREVSCAGTGLTDNTGGSYTANTDSADVTAQCTYADSSGVTAIFSEDFEGNNTCASLGYTVTNSADCQESTTVANGTYAAKITDDGTDSLIQMDLPSDYSELWMKFNYRTDDSAGFNWFIAYMRSGLSDRLQLKTVGRTPQVVLGAVSASYGSQLAANTWYTIKIRYVAGTGSDQIGELWIDAGIDQAQTGAADATFTTGAATGTVNRVLISHTDANGSGYFDDINVYESDPD